MQNPEIYIFRTAHENQSEEATPDALTSNSR